MFIYDVHGIELHKLAPHHRTTLPPIPHLPLAPPVTSFSRSPATFNFSLYGIQHRDSPQHLLPPRQTPCPVTCISIDPSYSRRILRWEVHSLRKPQRFRQGMNYRNWEGFIRQRPLLSLSLSAASKARGSQTGFLAGSSGFNTSAYGPPPVKKGA